MKKGLFRKMLCMTGLTGGLIAGIMTADNAYADDTDNGLIAHFTFDGIEEGELTDFDGNNKVLAVEDSLNITYKQGIHGQAAVFNGKDSMIQTVYDQSLFLGDGSSDDLSQNVTISFWCYDDDVEIKEAVYMQLGRSLGWTDDEFFSTPVYIDKPGAGLNAALSAKYIDNRSGADFETDGSEDIGVTYSDGHEWNLMTVTYDGSKIKFYRNNKLMNQMNYSAGITHHNPYGLTFGMNADDNNKFYKGMLDDFRMYNRTLSYNEVEALYQKGVKASPELVEPSKKLVAYYAFENNLEDASQYSNTAEKVESAGMLKYEKGAVGYCSTLTNGAYIQIPDADQLNPDGEMTISYWLKVAQNDEGERIVLYRQNPVMGDSDYDRTYAAYVSTWSGQNFSSTFYSHAYEPANWTVGSDMSESVTGNDVTCYGWNHYGYTVSLNEDGMQMIVKSYLNGILQNTSEPYDANDISNASGSLLIGYDGKSTDFFRGAIDELKIYNYALDETAMKSEYNRRDMVSLVDTDVKNAGTIMSGKTTQISGVNVCDALTGSTSFVPATSELVTFTSADSSIASVDDNGLITGVSTYGSTTIYVNYNGFILKCPVSVTASVPTQAPSPIQTPQATLVPTVTLTDQDSLYDQSEEDVYVGKVVIKSLKNIKGRKLSVVIKKAVSGTDGYVIRYSLKSSMKSARTVTLKKSSTLKATIKKLRKGSRYYVQIRAFKVSGDKKYFGDWSSRKSIKIKK